MNRHTRSDSQSDEKDPELEAAQSELKRAYLLLGWGNYEEAIEICEEVDASLDGKHHLPETMRGSFLLAQGKVREALKVLRGVTKRFSDEALPQIYFAEACYLAGRQKQGDRALRKAKKLDGDGEHAELLENLEETWEDVDPADVPPPLKVDA